MVRLPVPAEIADAEFIVRVLVFVANTLVSVSTKLPTLICPIVRPVPVLGSEFVTTTAPRPVLVFILRVCALVLNAREVLPIAAEVVLSDTVWPVAR